MSLKLFGIALALAVVAGAGYVIWQQRQTVELLEARPPQPERFLDFDPAAITRITAQWFDREAVLARQPGAAWHFEKGGNGLDPAAANRLLTALADATVEDYAKATPSQLAELQLVLPDREGWGSPGIILTLDDGAGNSVVRLLVGRHPGEGEGALDTHSKGRYVARIKGAQPPDEVALIPPSLEMVDEWVDRKNPPYPVEAPSGEAPDASPAPQEPVAKPATTPA